LYPNRKNTIEAIENFPIFFTAIEVTDLVVTSPASSRKKPSAIVATAKAQKRKENVLKIYSTSGLTSAKTELPLRHKNNDIEVSLKNFIFTPSLKL
tara:strand:- start:295 stop:582 length:288 start_codon:yes stop_codon:yes gene_type:complete